MAKRKATRGSMGKFLGRLFVLALVLAAVVGFYLLVPYGPTTETFVEIAPGTGTAGIAKQLEQAGVIRSRFAFEAVKLAKPGTLKAGEYRFAEPASVLEVYRRIRRGDVYTIAVVVPPGFNLFDIAEALEKVGLGAKQDFLDAAKVNVGLIRQWSPRATSLEGYLWPDTYRFQRRATPTQMQAAMLKRFGQQVQRLGMEADGTPGTAIERTVTMASLVEKEVRFDDERPEVASVFENRLAAGMPLQTDPAVIYASELRGTWTGVIHQSELRSDSPYNTYTHKGLPPGPICSPGVAALKAAMHPVQTNYLYFVADASGRTRFAASLGEHNANVAAYRAGGR